MSESFRKRAGLAAIVLTAALVSQLGLIGYLRMAGEMPKIPLERPLSEIPKLIGDWVEAPEEAQHPLTDEENFADEHYKRTFVNPRKQLMAQVFISYSSVGSDRGHHPEVCQAVAGQPEMPQFRAAIEVEALDGEEAGDDPDEPIAEPVGSAKDSNEPTPENVTSTEDSTEPSAETESTEDSELELSEEDREALRASPIQQFVFRNTQGRHTAAFYWHYTLPPPPNDRISGLQRFYQRLQRRPSSVTLQVFVPMNSLEDLKAGAEFAVQIDKAFQSFLPELSVRGCDRLPVTVLRRDNVTH